MTLSILPVYIVKVPAWLLFVYYKKIIFAFSKIESFMYLFSSVKGMLLLNKYTSVLSVPENQGNPVSQYTQNWALTGSCIPWA